MANPEKWTEAARSSTLKEHSEKVRDYENRISELSGAVKSAHQQLNDILEIDSHRRAPIRISVDKDSEREAVAVAVGSDWHSEEVVLPENVNGLNEFNLPIAKARIERFFTSIIRLTEIERTGCKIDTLLLALLGDLMTGEIHDELRETNGLSATQAIIWLRDIIIAGIRLLKEKGHFKRIIIVCCYGNHGRTTKKPRHATGARNSYEWLLYQILAREIEGVEWVVAESYHTYVDIFGKSIRFHHGDGINYQGGIGGLTIPLEKAIASWNKAKVAELDVFGHWHTQQQNPKWVSNGSLIGFNAYSIAIKAPFEPPQQTFFLFDSKRGRTGTWPIFLQ